MKYAIIILSLMFVGSVAYAFSIETDPAKIIEQKNRERVLSCMESIHSFTWRTEKMQKEIEKCSKISLESILNATGGIAPVPLRIKKSEKSVAPVPVSIVKHKKSEPIVSLCTPRIILRKWWNDPRVQFGYNLSCWDMDFIKTIEAESKWDVNALWDHWNSFWLCQIHKKFNGKMQKAYRALVDDNSKIEFCYNQYKDWVKRWVIKTRLYGYNVRNLPQNKNSFTFLQ